MWAQGCNYTGSGFVTGYMPYRLARHTTSLSSGENTEARSISHQECWHIPELRVTYRNRPAERDTPRTRNLWPNPPEISLMWRLISRQTVASLKNSVCELSMKTGNKNAQLWRWACWAGETQTMKICFPAQMENICMALLKPPPPSWRMASSLKDRTLRGLSWVD